MIYSPRGVPEDKPRGEYITYSRGTVNNMLIFLLVRFPKGNKDH